MVLPDKWYNILKWVALILCPALSTLYAALAGFWRFPYPEQICGTISAIGLFIGAIIQVSSEKYARRVNNGDRL